MGFLLGMRAGGLTGAAATFGVGWGALTGAVVNGGVAWIEGASGPGIMMSSLFGLIGGAAGGAAGEGLRDLVFILGLSQFDLGLFTNWMY